MVVRLGNTKLGYPQNAATAVVEAVVVSLFQERGWNGLPEVVPSTFQQRYRRTSRSRAGDSLTDYRRPSGRRHRRPPVFVEKHLNRVSLPQPRFPAKPLDSRSCQWYTISDPCNNNIRVTVIRPAVTIIKACSHMRCALLRGTLLCIAARCGSTHC